MIVVFEVYLDSLADPNTLLSDEMKSETQAQIMSAEEARKVGFSGFQDNPDKGVLRLIAVDPKDQRFVQAAIERSGSVRGYDVHHVET